MHLHIIFPINNKFRHILCVYNAHPVFDWKNEKIKKMYFYVELGASDKLEGIVLIIIIRIEFVSFKI